MTDHLTADAPSSDTPEHISDLSSFTAAMTWGESLDARRKLAIEMSRRALDHLCPILSAHEIVTVTISYDGGGDEGQVEHIEAFGPAGSTELPDVECQRYGMDFSGTVYQEPDRLSSAIESFGYEVLEGAHDGWENNDGAFGTLTIDVASRAASLEHNSRFTTYDTETLELGEVPCPTPTTTR